MKNTPGHIYQFCSILLFSTYQINIGARRAGYPTYSYCHNGPVGILRISVS